MSLPTPLGCRAQLGMTMGISSMTSSAINPGPNRAADRPCIQAAAHAASKGGIPWASSPSTMPDSTSPLPAVASSVAPRC